MHGHEATRGPNLKRTPPPPFCGRGPAGRPAGSRPKAIRSKNARGWPMCTYVDTCAMRSVSPTKSPLIRSPRMNSADFYDAAMQLRHPLSFLDAQKRKKWKEYEIVI